MERKRIILRTWLVSAIVVLASVFPNRRGPFWNIPGVIGAARAECKRLRLGEVKSISYVDSVGHAWAFTFRSKVSIYTHLPPAVFVRFNGKRAFVSLDGDPNFDDSLIPNGDHP